MKVLLVCNANMGRSQVAEALFSQLSGESATSAGTVADEIVERTNPPSRRIKDGGSSAITYMSEQGVPLHMISVISYGETAPIADNSSTDGRAQNRRVLVRVLK